MRLEIESEPVVRLPSGGAERRLRDARLGWIYPEAPGEIDDLTRLKGVGEIICSRLHAAGIYTYRQVAEWGAGQVKAIGKELKLSDRIRRDGWQKQARALHKEKYGQAP